MRRLIHYVSLSFILFQAVAYAGIEFPPLLQSNEEIRLYIAQLHATHPWLPKAFQESNYKSVGWERAVAQEQKLIRDLAASPEFKAANEARPPFLEIVVETTSTRSEGVPSVHEQLKLLSVFLNELTGEIPLKNYDPLPVIIKNLELLKATDTTALFNGLGHIFSGNERREFFAAKDFASRMDLLIRHKRFSDSVLELEFRGAQYGIDIADLTREFFIAKLHELHDAEDALRREFLTYWFSSHLRLSKQDFLLGINFPSIQQAARNHLIQSEKAKFRDHPFIDVIVAQMGNVSDTTKNRYIELLVRPLSEMAKEVRIGQGKAPSYKHRFVLREVQPSLGIFRAFVGNDCSLDYSMAYPYNPFERMFFIYNDKDIPIGYAQGTVVETSEGRTLYLHDTTGRHGPSGELTNEFLEKVIAALYLSREALGVKAVTLPSHKQIFENNNDETPEGYRLVQQNLIKKSKGPLPQSYLDVPIRAILYRHSIALSANTDYASRYESPANNAIGYPLHADAFVVDLGSLKITTNIDKKLTTENSAMLGKADALMRALYINAGDVREQVLQEADSGISIDEVRKILTVLSNERGDKLADYYADVTKAFAAFEIKVSNKFISENERFFWRGHLASSDSLSSDDSAILDRSIRFIVNILKHSNVREHVYPIIAQHRDVIVKHERFQGYLKAFTGNRIHDREVFVALLHAGLNPRDFMYDDDKFSVLLNSRHPLVQLAAVEFALAQLPEGGSPSAEVFSAIARLLDNEKHADDSASLVAARLLLKYRTDREDVNKSLKRSYKYEDNQEIRVTAALALYKNIGNQKALGFIAENFESPQLSSALTAEIQLILNHFLPECQQQFGSDPQLPKGDK